MRLVSCEKCEPKELHFSILDLRPENFRLSIGSEDIMLDHWVDKYHPCVEEKKENVAAGVRRNSFISRRRLLQK